MPSPLCLIEQKVESSLKQPGCFGSCPPKSKNHYIPCQCVTPTGCNHGFTIHLTLAYFCDCRVINYYLKDVLNEGNM